jgi:serine phosphatase RsbU (regulator of sigma subunit)
MKRCDKMLLLSDGVVEVHNATGELFSFERMAQAAGATWRLRFRIARSAKCHSPRAYDRST